MKRIHRYSPFSVHTVAMMLLVLCAATVRANQIVTYSTQPTPDNSTPARATVGQFYRYDADATVSDGSPVRYSLSYGPSGMTVDAATGLVTWMPTSAGNYSVAIRAEMVNDPAKSTVQEWEIQANVLSSPTVSTDSLPIAFACAGYSITVDYTASGAFAPGNTFILQLSNPAGGFDSDFINIGSVSSTMSGSITALIPDKVQPDTGYRVRVISSNPVIIGGDNGKNFQITPKPRAEFLIQGKTNDPDDSIRNRFQPPLFMPIVLQGDTAEFANTGDSAASYLWEFGSGASPATSTLRDPGPVIYSSGGVKRVTLTITDAGGCGATLSTYGFIFVVSPIVPIPADVNIAQLDTLLPGGNTGHKIERIWVCPGSVYKYEDKNHKRELKVVFVEPGGSLSIDTYQAPALIYLKSGASLDMNEGFGSVTVVVYEDGAGIKNWYDYDYEIGRKVRVPSLTFDYSDAPLGGCPSLAPYTKRIPDDVLSISGTQSRNESGKEFWVRSGGDLEATGTGNIYIADSGAQIVASGNSSTIYLKNGASFQARAGGKHRIFYEPNATIVDAGMNSTFFPSSGITYLYPTVAGVDIGVSGDADNRITVAPNPASSSVVITNNSHGRTVHAVSLHDVLGAALREMDVTLHEGESIALQLEGIAPGTYYIRLHSDGGIIVKKLMVR